MALWILDSIGRVIRAFLGIKAVEMMIAISASG